MDSLILHWIDVFGAFIFALSGALVAVRKAFDIFGVFFLAFITATGGGVIRDVCIGKTPPQGLVNIEYFAAILIAVVAVRYCQRWIFNYFDKPSQFFDAIGLGFYASFGTAKVYTVTHNIEISLLLGCLTGIGGGFLRDIVAGRPPLVFNAELYASAALAGSIVQLLGLLHWIPESTSVWLAILVCTCIRMLAIKYNITLPSIKDRQL